MALRQAQGERRRLSDQHFQPRKKQLSTRMKAAGRPISRRVNSVSLGSKGRSAAIRVIGEIRGKITEVFRSAHKSLARLMSAAREPLSPPQSRMTTAFPCAAKLRHIGCKWVYFWYARHAASFPFGIFSQDSYLAEKNIPDREIWLAQTLVRVNNFPNGKLSRP